LQYFSFTQVFGLVSTTKLEESTYALTHTIDNRRHLISQGRGEIKFLEVRNIAFE